jgi:AMMECR1 domain-containing protein
MKSGGEYDLRGCIGTFSDGKAVREVIPEYAKISAFSDSRFPPVRLEEVPNLKVAVSLLLNFTKIEDPFGFEIGRHGVQLNF